MSESEDSRKQWQISVLSQTAKDPLTDKDIEAFMKDLVTNRCIDTLLEDFAADKCIDTLLEDFMAENEISLVSRKILVAPKAKRQVQVRVVFIKIEEINTVEEHYSGIVFIRARWREPSLDSSPNIEADKINWGDLWNPLLEVQNVKGETKSSLVRELDIVGKGEVFLVEKRRLKGTFSESMELGHFPFDIQDLSVLVTSDLREEEVEIIEDERDLSLVDINAFGDEQEWDLHNCVMSEPKTLTRTDYSQFTHTKPGRFFRCCASRRSGFFVWNIMFIMTIISLSSFVTFALDHTAPASRIQLSFLLLLAGVTFKFNASQSVPRISYLTHLDRFIIGSMIFMFLVSVWHGVLTRISDQNLKADLDKWAFIGFVILYVVLIIVFLIVTSITGYRRRSDIEHKKQEYYEKAERLSGNKQSFKRPSRGGLRRSLAKVGLF